MSRKKLLSIKAFVQLEDPFENISYLARCLRSEKNESRYLEWKQRLPIGKDAEKREKYRFVRAAISFANTDGGFVTIGVNNQGEWIGLPSDKVEDLDTAHFSQLFAECISHEFDFKVSHYQYRGKTFLILYVPASLQMPHVTTKDITDRLPSKKAETLISKNSVYCRKSARSDVATLSDYERIIRYRTEFVRDELVRRIETVTVELPIPTKAGIPTDNSTTSNITTMKDGSATPFRRTADKTEANTILTHEEIDEGIFDDVNNIIDANRKFAYSKNTFVLPRHVYYRIYAAREDVFDNAETYQALFWAGLHGFYGPYLYWFTKLTPAQAAKAIGDLGNMVLDKSRHTSLNYLVRLMLLLGDAPASWLENRMKEAWKNHPQPPNYYFKFLDLQKALPGTDRRSAVIEKSYESILGNGTQQRTGDLISNSSDTSSLLTTACKQVSENSNGDTSLCRTLDIVVYGLAIQQQASEVMKALEN